MDLKKPSLLILIAIIALSLFACEKEKKETKSIEKIRAEKGIPVEIKKIEKSEFVKELHFFSTLKGAKEAVKRSMTADKIKKINANVGSYVKEGQIIVEYPTDNPSLQYEQAKVGYENAKKTYERMKALLEAGETSRQNFDNAKTQYLVQKRNFESLKQILYVESPISGYITDIPVNEGDEIGTGKPLFTVAQINKMKAKFWSSEEEIAKIKKGMSATIEYSGSGRKGRISKVAMAMNPKRKAFAVEAIFQNSDKELISGVTVEIAVKIYENPDAIIVPKNLIVTRGDKNWIFVEKDGVAEKREVEIGMQNGVSVEITKGLKEGENLINCCQNQLSDGVKVQVVR